MSIFENKGHKLLLYHDELYPQKKIRKEVCYKDAYTDQPQPKVFSYSTPVWAVIFHFARVLPNYNIVCTCNLFFMNFTYLILEQFVINL